MFRRCVLYVHMSCSMAPTNSARRGLSVAPLGRARIIVLKASSWSNPRVSSMADWCCLRMCVIVGQTITKCILVSGLPPHSRHTAAVRSQDFVPAASSSRSSTRCFVSICRPLKSSAKYPRRYSVGLEVYVSRSRVFLSTSDFHCFSA